MRRTWRPTCWTSSNASSRVATTRRRSAGRTSPKRTARKGCSASRLSDKVAQRAVTMMLEAVYEQLSALLVWLPPGPLGSPGAPHFAERTLGQATPLGRRHRHTQVFQLISALPSGPSFRPTRVHGRVIRRMIDKWLNAGAVEDGLLHRRPRGLRKGASSRPVSRTSSCTTCWTNGSRPR